MMESRKRTTTSTPYPPSPLPDPPSSSIFRDISNFKTPKRPSKFSSFQSSPQFFTASKNTPFSSSRRCFKSSALKSKAARRLKAYELEQSKSARKVQSEKEKSVKSLARSLTVWLNFLFENPGSCGCDPATFTGETDGFDLSLGGGVKEVLLNNGKRESVPGQGVGIDGPWRVPKRQRGLSWRMEGSDEGGDCELSNFKFLGLRASLEEICSFEDLKDRMRMYLSLGNCRDIFKTMDGVTKNIDEGRLRMKASCPIVSDVAMKEKAIGILMCYDPIWLRIGLYIILGGDPLLPNGDVSSEHENAFLRMVLEKQFLSHTGLAKAHAYNKKVEGLYRPGYYETLGNVILKRFLLLVIILDRAKSQTSLPLKYGIDGKDGGSPPLFTLKANAKSSRQVISDFLSSEVMHGEGNILAHLLIVGYRLTYQQNLLIEYDFKVTDLFEDLRNGIRLCRAIELLKHDPSILMKVVVPADSQKKSLTNCGVVLEYLKQAGVPLLDEDGTEIIAEDIVNGDKELTLSLLWNIFIHLQLPLLINKSLLLEEVSHIQGVASENVNNQTLLDLLLSWIKAICETYELKIDSHSSLLDGKALWCLLDYYFRKEHDCSCFVKEPDGTKTENSIMSAIEYTDAVHNFILSQKLTSLLGNFPEVLQVSDILEHNGACNGQSVIVLLVFLAVQLLVKRNLDKLNFHKLLGFGCQPSNSRRRSTDWNNEKDPARDFKAIMAWWQDMAKQNGKCSLKPDSRNDNSVQRENAAIIIQSHYRSLIARRNYRKVTNAALVLKSAIFAWLSERKKKTFVEELRARMNSENLPMYVALMVDRHQFVDLKRSILVIQQAIRSSIARKHYEERAICNQMHNAAMVIQSCVRGCMARSNYRQRIIANLQTSAAIIIQRSWKDHIMNRQMHIKNSAATKIQSNYRGWVVRKRFASKKSAIRTIQRRFRLRVEYLSAVVVQSHVRGWMARRRANRALQQLESAAIKIQHSWRGYLTNKLMCQHSAAAKIQSQYRSWINRKNFTSKKQAATTIQRSLRCLRSIKNFQIHREKHLSAIIIQAHVRGWIARRQAKQEKNLVATIQRKEIAIRKNSAIKIQNALRGMNCRKEFYSQRRAAVEIQSFIRGENTRKILIVTKSGAAEPESNTLLQSAVKLQKWWRNVLQTRIISRSAMVIQSCYRGWRARKLARREKQSVVVLQSYWKGYLARKYARAQLRDLRLRMQKSAANIDDNMRLINRLVAAVSELLSMRSLSGILHTCATLNMATELSQKCCEELVNAGAIATLLKLIRSVSRSIPDQQVLKHALSTLRNLARFPHLAEILLDCRGSVETIVLEFLRNKEDGYFIAADLLKRMCAIEKGAKAIGKSPALVKRLNNIAEDLAKKAAAAGKDKRKKEAAREISLTERRLKEVVELLKIITKNC
ncbi:uncharacterized protein LOC127249473 isoform X2 [Andrographis paniculata]|uniref:uncharacterized protein LOC127249473 isoform X2 n=1 Tax=Andrographis paniculata TaxID=175694 RepID=UPI0021E78C2D|nr:uncharacterized protein LOC127249473 isoform X2 [Andrographis paniculata]